MNTFHDLIGSNAETISWWQMAIRALLVFVYTLVLVRWLGRRVFEKYSSFDIVLGIILGSTISRALTGNARFTPTLLAVGLLVLLHRLLTECTRRNATLARVVKGSAVLLVKDGEIQRESLRHTSLTENDLLESLRLSGKPSVRDVQAAYLERSGQVSIISR